ncbi:MAG TPA: FmdB family zinc ribbon protein [Actinomycetota bacterium]|nr:FmdB family zinc ribbon protein [Actinomycetota bacterium]
MPTYEYACTSCEERIEVYQAFSDDPLEKCEKCGGRLRRVFHPVGVMFKGSGFYSTDAKKGKSKTRDGAAKSTEKSSSESKSSDSGSDSSSGPSKDSGSPSKAASGDSSGGSSSSSSESGSAKASSKGSD